MSRNPLIEAIYILADDIEVGWNTDPAVRRLVSAIRRIPGTETDRNIGAIGLVGSENDYGGSINES